MHPSSDVSQESQAGPAVAAVGRGAPPRWSRRQLVRVRGDRWLVERARPFADCDLLHLAGIGRTNRGRRLALLYPFDRPERLEPSGRLRRVGCGQWLRAFRALAGSATPFGRLHTAAFARIDLHPYQLEPALAVLNGLATRLLLADEVGLGKTIQAGILVSELQAREPGARALILTPAGLRDQWASELRERFSIDAAVVDAAMIRRTIAQVAAGTNPWSVWPVIIASLDFVKRPEVLRALDPFTWDALLVDEAHTCASAPERSAAVRRLAARARHVVLLTATPHAGDDLAFAALCRIGELRNGSRSEARSHASELVMFRRTRPGVGLAQTRRVHLFHVRCTDAEYRMHRLLARYTRAVWSSAEASADARLAMIVLRKRALSSAVSLARSLERRLDGLFDTGQTGAQLALPFAGSAEPDDQTPEDDEPIGDLAAPGMDGRRERAWLTRLLEAAGAAACQESKIARLSRLLSRAREPVVIFTEYRDTARWLASALAPLGPIVLLHGGLSRAERLDAERTFRTGGADILVATDAAGEGLNLQHRCRLVVNLELPWNPMRLEQRIGRVDRLGQRRRPHAIHLVAAGTAEERIVGRLLFRQERARRAVGCVTDAVGATREEDVAQAVMSGAIASRPVVQPPAEDRAPGFSTLDLREMAVDEVRRLSVVRALTRLGVRSETVAFFTPGTGVRCEKSDRFRPDPAGCEKSDRFRPDPAGCEKSDRFRPDPGGTSFSVLPARRARRSGLSRGLVCLFVVRLLCADAGEVIDESLVALHLEPARSLVDLDRAGLDRLVNSPALRHRVLSLASGRLKGAEAVHRRTTLAARAREEALAAAERRPSLALQPGMFDRRALRQAEREQGSRVARESEEADRLARFDQNASGEPVVQVELALVLIVDR